MKTRREEAEVILGTDRVVIRRRGVSRVEIAGILDRQNDQHGNPVRLVLDRRVQGPRINQFGEWAVSGAMVSVLERPIVVVAG